MTRQMFAAGDSPAGIDISYLFVLAVGGIVLLIGATIFVYLSWQAYKEVEQAAIQWRERHLPSEPQIHPPTPLLRLLAPAKPRNPQDPPR